MTQICVRAVLPVWGSIRGTTRDFSAPRSPSSVLPRAPCEVSLKDSPG